MTDILGRLKGIISVFNVYDVERDVFLQAELKAYSVGLAIIKNMLEEVERECFVVTACDYGLTEKEVMFGSGKEGIPVNRRNMLIEALSSDRDFTLEGMQKFLAGFPVGCRIVETPREHKVIIYVDNNSWYRENENYFKSSVKRFFPAHLNIEFNPRGEIWTEIDAKNYTYSSFDSYGFNWNQLENVVKQ